MADEEGEEEEKRLVDLRRSSLMASPQVKMRKRLLGDKMNLTVRLGTQFSESSPCLPRQLGAGQQGRYSNGTLIKHST